MTSSINPSLLPGSSTSATGSPTLSIYDLELQGATLVARSLMGIMPDSINRPLSQIDAFTLWKYASNASNPSIPMLIRIRVTLKFEGEIQTIWTKAFEELLSYIKAETREAFVRESRLPSELRSSSFASLDRAFGWAATSMSWLSRVAQPMSDDELAVTRTPANLMLPVIATEAANVHGVEVLNQANAFVNTLGHNYRNYDGLTKFMNDINDVLKGG
jgi:hypothetical protein